jgi:hypothetical protein
MSDDVIAAEHLTKSYGATRGVQDLTFTVEFAFVATSHRRCDEASNGWRSPSSAWNDVNPTLANRSASSATV